MQHDVPKQNLWILHGHAWKLLNRSEKISLTRNQYWWIMRSSCESRVRAPSRLRGRSGSRVRDWVCWSTALVWSLWRTTWWLFVRKCGLFGQTVRRSDFCSGVRSYDSSWSDCWKILCQGWLLDVYGWRTLLKVNDLKLSSSLSLELVLSPMSVRHISAQHTRRKYVTQGVCIVSFHRRTHRSCHLSKMKFSGLKFNVRYLSKWRTATGISV